MSVNTVYKAKPGNRSRCRLCRLCLSYMRKRPFCRRVNIFICWKSKSTLSLWIVCVSGSSEKRYLEAETDEWSFLSVVSSSGGGVSSEAAGCPKKMDGYFTQARRRRNSSGLNHSTWMRGSVLSLRTGICHYQSERRRRSTAASDGEGRTNGSSLG